MNRQMLFKQPRDVRLRPTPLIHEPDGTPREQDDIWRVQKDTSGPRRLHLRNLTTGHTKSMEDAGVAQFIDEARPDGTMGLLRLRYQILLVGDEVVVEPLDVKTRELLGHVRQELLTNTSTFSMHPNPFSTSTFPYHREMLQQALRERQLHWPEDTALWHALERAAQHLEKIEQDWEFCNNYRLGRLEPTLAATVTQDRVLVQIESDGVVGLFNHQLALARLEAKLGAREYSLVLDQVWAATVIRHHAMMPEFLDRPMVLPLHKAIVTKGWDHFLQIATALNAGRISGVEDLPEIPDGSVNVASRPTTIYEWDLDNTMGWITF